MTDTTTPTPSSEQCAECAELERKRQQARDDGDYSKASDYKVLIGRHPTHDPDQQPAPRTARKARA